MKKVLIVDDTIVLNENLKASYKKKIENEGFKIEILGYFEDALDYINKSCPDFLVVDTRFPFRKGANAEKNYEPLIDHYQEKCPKDQIKDHIIVISGDENILSRIKYTGCMRDENGQMLVKILKGESEGYKAEVPYLVQCFSSLKHRVAHLFLSMDVDLQGVAVLRNQMAKGEIQNAANTPEAYLRDVLNNKEKTYYRQKIAELQYMVLKEKLVTERAKDNDPCKESPEGIQPSANVKRQMENIESVIELVDSGADKRSLRQNDVVEGLKERLYGLSGLGFYQACMKCHSSSPIFKFMCMMDCTIHKKNYDNVGHILDYFAKIEGDKGWTVDGSNVSPISSFHDWFCALVDCLEKLRKVIKSD